MCVFILNIIIYRCNKGYYEGTTGCTLCLPGCAACIDGATCTSCKDTANRVVWATAATTCVYLF
jgi:hypothetical protein